MASQFGQDQLVLSLLGGKRGGFFLDSGAADGLRASNTYMLETNFGWNGICIEPNDAFYAALINNRRCQCVNCCLYNRDGPVDFLEASTLGGIVDEYSPIHLEYTVRELSLPLATDGRPATVQKPAHTIQSVLQACGAPAMIDYWSLDTEGSELKILQSFPYDKYRFRVLTVEHNYLPVRSEIRAFIERRGYEFVCAIGVDDCYMAAGGGISSAWRSLVWRR
ncbi:FkbM family methyltransferase [Inquilinus ginsengisoli]|uniref:FkbM family methyltransferase n=1 Tax=Inquilinus ginsengisoli TaxID=363840 RepID=UPI003D235247